MLIPTDAEALSHALDFMGKSLRLQQQLKIPIAQNAYFTVQRCSVLTYAWDDTTYDVGSIDLDGHPVLDLFQTDKAKPEPEPPSVIIAPKHKLF